MKLPFRKPKKEKSQPGQPDQTRQVVTKRLGTIKQGAKKEEQPTELSDLVQGLIKGDG